MNPIDNAIVLDEAKRYTNSQRLAYTEWTEGEITWDGDTTDKVVLSGIDLGVTDAGNVTYVRISKNSKYNPLNIKQIAEIFSDGRVNDAYIEFDIVYTEDNGACFVYEKGKDDSPLLLIIFDDPEISGTYAYFLENEINLFVSSITGNIIETIHPIDPKFLPGVTLNLCDYGINVYELFKKGTSGYFRMDTSLARELNAKIPTDGSMVVLMTNDGINPKVLSKPVTIACLPNGKAGIVSILYKTLYFELNAILDTELYISFTYNQTDGSIDATDVYYTTTAKALPTTEVN